MLSRRKHRSAQFIGVRTIGPKTFAKSKTKSDQVVGPEIIFVLLDKPLLFRRSQQGFLGGFLHREKPRDLPIDYI